MIGQEKYIFKLGELNYERFKKLGHAIPGHNGPHGHLDTPVRNTAHYLVIYTYLYKKTEKKEYLDLCKSFADYLCTEQAKSRSGAIECMITDKFDHLNGVIGQAWVIEALLYYYALSKDDHCLECAKSIFLSQKYNYDKHAFERVELDGRNIGVDVTYNHQVWFLACSSPLEEYYPRLEMGKIVKDFLSAGTDRDFRVYRNGELYHAIAIESPRITKKTIVKALATPISNLCPQKLDLHYINRGYHIFDMYGFCILKERYGDLPFFSSPIYKKAVDHAKDIETFNRRNKVYKHIKNGVDFNIYGYGYNSPAFELPYVSLVEGFYSEELCKKTFQIQKRLMFDKQTGIMCRNNADVETWNAKTYEIVRFLDLLNLNY
ncbi:hypothetical protein SAMN02910317_01317 [Ruminococcaceae bacterium FB2012]|nr:hypothetical protein SAMN02910317_01317 [Ruminococcaceae bacterium FB2012]